MLRKGKNRVRTRNGWRHDQRRGVIWFPVGNRAHELHILTLQCLQEGIPSGYCVAVGSCGSTTMQWQPSSSTLGIGAPIWGPTVCDMSKMPSAGTGTAQIIAAATAKAAVEPPDGLSAAGAKGTVPCTCKHETERCSACKRLRNKDGVPRRSRIGAIRARRPCISLGNYAIFMVMVQRTSRQVPSG
jgi:hypothetical protein